MTQERRRSPRYPFFASAELIEDKSDVRITTRLSELGLYGCYLDMMNPFPTGTSVLIKITEGQVTFEAHATVVYSQVNMGMGVAFRDVEDRYLKLLQKWMTDAQNR
jgi:PilZ domain